MKIIKLGIQQFAVPSPKRGSIEASSAFGTTFQKGLELHQKIQAQRKEELPEYETEVHLDWTFEAEIYSFEISGRADGLIPGDKPVIEEIKSSFNIFDLGRSIKEKRFDHPYFLQLVTYGYIYWLNFGKKPELVFKLVSSRRNESFDFTVYWDLKEYEGWLSRDL